VLQASLDHFLTQLLRPFANAWASREMFLMLSIGVGLLADGLVITRNTLIRNSLETHNHPLLYTPSSLGSPCPRTINLDIRLVNSRWRFVSVKQDFN
jgi:hypothetical protein